MKITKEEFDSLYSDDITKKQYNYIISKIDKRFGEIVYFMAGNKRKNHHWFDYSNGDSRAEIDGYFDPIDYKEYISINDYFPSLPEPYYSLDYSIPTRWLYEDFEEEFTREVEECKVKVEEKKKKAKEKREALKIKKTEMKEQIKAKLTPEELKFIKFK